MSRFYAVTWEDGNFDRTAIVLSFDSKAARSAYPAQSAMRVEPINHARKEQLVKDGRKHWLMLWDASEPTKFVPVQ